jgi:DNA modification methylase
MHNDREKLQWNGKGSYGIWKCSGTRGKEDRHPNEKPLALCLMLVAKFSNRGETILDPFCGSGAIGEACMLLGRRYVGLDQDPEWVTKATARVHAASFGYGSMPDDAAIALCGMKGANNGQPDPNSIGEVDDAA